VRKKGDGQLELEVLQILWAAEDALQPVEVQARLAEPLAYTSVATILTRLTAKGLVIRQPSGRSFTYQAATTQEDWNAAKMLSLLKETPDHQTLLAGFVRKLSKRDREALKAMLTEKDGA
jgi:predicted transcriptional regulator